MPWSCPACHTQIHHAANEDRPRSNSLYRCHICRLELVLDPETDRLMIAPIREDEPEPKDRTR
jgi:hypothetical protein